MAGGQRSMRRPPCPQEDNRNNVEKQRDDDNDGGNDNENHCGAVETNSGESNGANCYLEPFDNTTIRYELAAMV